MNKNNYILLCVSLLLGFGSIQPAVADITVFADVYTGTPPAVGVYTPTAEVSGPFSVTYYADTGGASLFGFGMVTSFDPTVVQAANTGYGSDWTFFNGQPVADNTAGAITSIASVGFTASPVAGSAVPLYSVEFNPLGYSGTFNLTNNTYPSGNQFVDINANRLPVTFELTQIQVIPVPAAFWMMLSGLTGFVGMRSGRSKS